MAAETERAHGYAKNSRNRNLCLVFTAQKKANLVRLFALFSFSFFYWVFSLNFSSACQVLLLGVKTEQTRNVCGCNARRRAGGRGGGDGGWGG